MTASSVSLRVTIRSTSVLARDASEADSVATSYELPHC